jgi:hypothetical protein
MWLGKNLRHKGFNDCCIYRGDVLVDHMHPTAGKASWSEPVYQLQLMRMKRDKCDQLYASKKQERENDLQKILKILKD